MVAKPESFFRQGAPPEERVTVYDRTVEDAGARAAQEAAAAPPPPPRVDPSTPVGSFVRSTTEIVSSAVGPIALGSIVRHDDPRVARVPEAGWRWLVDTI